MKLAKSDVEEKTSEKLALTPSKESEASVATSSRAAGKGTGSGPEGIMIAQEPGSEAVSAGTSTAEEPVLGQAAAKDNQKLSDDGAFAKERWSDWTDNWWNHGSGYWYDNRDWSWGLGSRHDWNTWEVEHSNYQWRRRNESSESLLDDASEPAPTSEPATPKPIQRRTSSLDSEMMAAFNRMTTIDQENKKLQNLDPSTKPQNLDPKFQQVLTPEKLPEPPLTTPEKRQETPSTSPGPSPSSSASPGASTTSLEAEAKKKEGEDEKQAKEDDKAKDDAASKEGIKDKTQEKLEGMKKRKMAAHARYMRYYRSVHGTGLSCVISFMPICPCFYMALEMIHVLFSLRKQEDAH